MRKFLRQLLIGSTMLYVWGLIGIRAGYWLTGDTHWWIITPMMFFALLSIPVLLAWVVAIWTWQRGLLVGCVLLSGLIIQLYAPRFNRANAATGAEQLSVISMNVLAHTTDLTETAERIRIQDADIVGMQEVTPALAIVLANDLADLYPYQIHDPGGVDGMSVLSKYPFEATEFVRNSFWVGNTQALIVEHPNGPFALLNQHHMVTGPYTLDPAEFAYIVEATFAERIRNVQDTEAWLGLYPDMPVIITADMNSTDFSDAYKAQIDLGFADTWHEVGNGVGFTFPVPRSLAKLAALPFSWLRIDYIFHTAEFRPLTIEKLPAGQSDHYGLAATFEFTQ